MENKMSESVSKTIKLQQSHYNQAFDWLEKELKIELTEHARQCIKVIIIKVMSEFDLNMVKNEKILKKAVGDDYTITTDPNGNQVISKKDV